MATTHSIVDNSFEISKHLLRGEDSGYLMFVTEQEKTYLLNPTAAKIIQCLNNGDSLEQVCTTLKHYYQLDDGFDVESQLNEFIAQLKDMDLVRSNSHTSKTLQANYFLPTIVELEKMDEKGTQCRMFGMP